MEKVDKESDRSIVMSLLLKMYSSTSKDEYKKYVKELENIGQEKFYNFFLKEYDVFYESWTSIYRSSNMSLFQSNNVSETIFKGLQSYMSNKVRSLNDYLQRTRKYMRNIVLNKAKGLNNRDILITNT